MTKWNDEKLDIVVGRTLQIGVIAAAALIFLGGLGHVLNVHTFNSLAIVQAGIILLIATPVVRVGICVLGFALERDWTYVVISAMVLSLLLFAIF